MSRSDVTYPLVQRLHAPCPTPSKSLHLTERTVQVSQCLPSGNPPFTCLWRRSPWVVRLAGGMCRREAPGAGQARRRQELRGLTLLRAAWRLRLQPPRVISHPHGKGSLVRRTLRASASWSSCRSTSSRWLRFVRGGRYLTVLDGHMKPCRRHGCVGSGAYVAWPVALGLRWGSWNLFPVDKAARPCGV